jgi:hypothetical protein
LSKQRFLKKARKNFCAFTAQALTTPAGRKSFFGSFFTKKELLSF